MADVAGFIEDYVTFSDASTVPVFRLKDLTEIYKKQVVLHGASAKETETVHATRFKGEILKPVPCLCELKDVKYVLLTLESGQGVLSLSLVKALSMNDGMILAKAVAIVGRQMLDVNETFDGDLSREVKRVLMPNVLW